MIVTVGFLREIVTTINNIEPTAYLYFGQGTVPTLIEDSLTCTGTESGILLCPPSSNSTEGEICHTVTVRCHDSKCVSQFLAMINNSLSLDNVPQPLSLFTMEQQLTRN